MPLRAKYTILAMKELIFFSFFSLITHYKPFGLVRSERIRIQPKVTDPDSQHRYEEKELKGESDGMSSVFLSIQMGLVGRYSCVFCFTWSCMTILPSSLEPSSKLVYARDWWEDIPACSASPGHA